MDTYYWTVKKTDVLKVLRFTGTNTDRCISFCPILEIDGDTLLIPISGGKRRCRMYDVITLNNNGEYGVCSEKDFEEKYTKMLTVENED